MTPLHVVVLAGGLSHEREVSLRSGRRVAAALGGAGVETTVRDVDPDLLRWLRSEQPACVLPLLHGASGEDGSLREILELATVPYVGSTPGAARLAFDKPIAKQVLRQAGVQSPASVTLAADTFREMGAAAVLAALVERLGLPLFVKPAQGGSALGGSAVHTAGELPAAMVACFGYGPVALVEKLVTGVEVSVPVLDTSDGRRALVPVEIRPASGVYDYTSRYTAGATEFVVPPELASGVVDSCGRAALTAHDVLGLRDLSRSDLIVDEAGTVWFLEVNVAPGMTETSLVPLSIEESGLDLGRTCAELCQRATNRVRSAQKE
jgi:D-alanine-D-alanine ligase